MIDSHAASRWFKTFDGRILIAGLLLLTFTFDYEDRHNILVGLPILAVGVFLGLPKIAFPPRQYYFCAMPAILYFASLCFSVFFVTGDTNPAVTRIVTHALGVLVFLYILQTLKHEGTEGKAIEAWLVALGLSGLMIGIHFFTNLGTLLLTGRIADALNERYIGGSMAIPWGASNTIAGALFIPLIASLWLGGIRKTRSWTPFLCAIVAIAVIIVTMSRGAIAALTIGGVFYLALTRRVRLILIVLFVLLVLCALLAYAVGWQYTTEYLESRFDAVELMEFNGRIRIWEEQWQYLCQEFPVPFGYCASREMVETGAHNLVLVTTLELGIWGFAAFCWVNAALLIGLFRQRTIRKQSGLDAHACEILICGIVAMLCHLMVEDAHYTFPYIIYQWTFWGVATHQAARKTTVFVKQSRCRWRGRSRLPADIGERPCSPIG